MSRTLAAGFSAPEKRVLLVVPEDADIRPLNGCDVISAKTLHTRVIPVPDVVIIDDVEKCKSVSSTATIKRILRCSTSTVVFGSSYITNQFCFAEHPQLKAYRKRA